MRIFLLAKDPLLINAFKVVYDDFYYLSDLEDVSFRLPEFAPDLILINEDFISEQGDEIRVLEEVSAQIPVVPMIFQEREQEIKKKGWKGPFLYKPIDYGSLREILKNLFTQLKA